MRLKAGVRIRGITPEMAFVMPIIESVYLEYGTEAVITSVSEGRHMRGSKHYTGCAVDVRTRTVDTEHHAPLCASLRGALEEDFDVVLERDHIHIEYDPKTEG